MTSHEPVTASPRQRKQIDRKLKAVGAAPLEDAGSETPADTECRVNEEQIALSTWITEDADAGLRVISITIAALALVIAASTSEGINLRVLIGIVAIIVIGLGYIIASDRHAAAAAAAVIAFRADTQKTISHNAQTSSSAPPRRALIDIKINCRRR
jgi:hypothetical protein